MESEYRSERLERQIASLESILDDLRDQLRGVKSEEAGRPVVNNSHATNTNGSALPASEASEGSFTKKRELDNHINGRTEPQNLPLALDDYKRYGRQMIMPEIGLPGQLRLKSARVLVIGLGGLGCPAAMYLAGAGVGTMGLMDGDTVELSNLHRQLLHTTDRIGMKKAVSAAKALKAINPSIIYRAIPHDITPSSLSDIEFHYDLLLDCTDNPASRYLISDLAVAARIPLISASALKTDGQLLVLNNPPLGNRLEIDKSGFCYRCVFPRPPPPETVLSCGEGGILGPVVGVMGTLMAVESIKLLSKNNKNEDVADEGKRMLLYSAWGDPPFRTVKLKGKRTGCETCSHPQEEMKRKFRLGAIDYNQFCGSKMQTEDHNLARLQPIEYARRPHRNRLPLLDVRSQTEWRIAHIENACPMPLSYIQSDPTRALLGLLHMSAALKEPVVFVCRYGNDSQEALKIANEVAKQMDVDLSGPLEVGPHDIKGGLKAWREQVDPDFPEY